MAAKIVRLSKRVEPTGCIVEKFSLAESKKILNVDGAKYTDEEVILIRDFLHQFAEINYLYYLEWKQKQVTEQIENNPVPIKNDIEQTETKIIQLNTNTDDKTQSNSLCTSEYGRTG